MRCPRCGGMMHYEQFVNTMGDQMPWSFDGWRCFYCGEIIDPLILFNRSLHQQKAKTLEEEEEETAAGARWGRG